MLIKTKADWDSVEKLLSPVHPVKLLIDGYDVTLAMKRTDTLEYRIFIFVDGELKGIWILEDCDIRRRFLWKREEYAFSKNMRTFGAKNFGKTKARENGYFKKMTFYENGWKSFRTLRNHFRQHNKSIELVEGK